MRLDFGGEVWGVLREGEVRLDQNQTYLFIKVVKLFMLFWVIVEGAR